VLAGYFTRRAAQRFARVDVRGLENLAAWSATAGNPPASGVPLLLAANHSSWWDAVLPIVISLRTLGQDAYGMMDEQQLRRYSFFARAGIFSVDRSSPRSAMATLEYAATLLRGTPRVLWMFPQGMIVPNDRRPIQCETGIARLARMIGECAIVPVAIRYEVGREERPIACASIGRPTHIHGGETTGVRELTHGIEAMMETELDDLRATMLAEHYAGFSTILAGRSSVNARWDRARRLRQAP
jgi:1-acyl-sn-glycerol-3-phosphate acyltransferase